jgi:hypothetical protein
MVSSLKFVILIFLIMPFTSSNVARRSSIKSAFGLPQQWKHNSLPTYSDVGKHFLSKQAEIDATLNGRVTNFEVAKQVYSLTVTKPFVTSFVSLLIQF